nr:MAG TPA: hypothetical protein [Caudoviricetes sp.]
MFALCIIRTNVFNCKQNLYLFAKLLKLFAF